MNQSDININRKIIESCSQRLPFFYPTEDKNINQFIEEKFSENLLNKLEEIYNNSSNMNFLDTSESFPIPSEDPIFGIKPIFSTNSVSFEDSKLELSNELSQLNINDEDSVCPINEFSDDETPSYGENPFLSSEKSPSYLNNNQENSISGSSIEYSKGMKVTDWLAMNDKEWLDSVLSQSNIDNTNNNKLTEVIPIKDIKITSSIEDLKIDIGENSLENYNIELIPSNSTNQHINLDEVEGSKRIPKLVKNWFSSFSRKKQNISLMTSSIQKPKTSIWKKWFKKVKKTKSVSQSLNVSENNSLNSQIWPSLHSLNKINENSFYFIYSFQDEVIPYRTKVYISIHNFALKHAKNIIPMSKDKKYRFYFKNIIFYECIERVVFDELTHDDQKCPFYGSEIVCKVLSS